MTQVSHDMLRGLYAHRLLSTSQLHELYAPACSLRWARLTLADLLRARYLGRVRIAGSRQYAWYLTPSGVAVTDGPGVERRVYRMTPERAAGPLQAHTLIVNEVGRLFTRAARLHDDDCGPSSWRNESAFRLGPGARAEVLIPDAVLEYTRYLRGEGTYLTRFLEVDRATTSTRTLVAKLEAYAALWSYPPAWRGFPRFPTVMVVMAGATPAALDRRLVAMANLIALSSPLASCPDLVLTATTLARLAASGPFSPIFWRLGEPVPVDLLGNTAPGPSR